MKHIISLLLSISLLFPYTALSYSYNVENWEVEAETSQNLENPEAQLVLWQSLAVPFATSATDKIVVFFLGSIGLASATMVSVLAYYYLSGEYHEDKKELKTELALICQKVGNEVESCITQVNKLNSRELHKIREIIEALQKLPPSVREELLLTAHVTIPLLRVY